MIYLYRCEGCSFEHEIKVSIKVGPPPDVACWECKDGMLARVWTPPNIICNTDPDFVPLKDRVTENTGFGDTKAQGHRKEAAYQRDLAGKRQRVKEAGHNPNSGRISHSVPTELYHGKIKQTGDKNYWKDPKNLNKHKSCKVS